MAEKRDLIACFICAACSGPAARGPNGACPPPPPPRSSTPSSRMCRWVFMVCRCNRPAEVDRSRMLSRAGVCSCQTGRGLGAPLRARCTTAAFRHSGAFRVTGRIPWGDPRLQSLDCHLATAPAPTRTRTRSPIVTGRNRSDSRIHSGFKFRVRSESAKSESGPALPEPWDTEPGDSKRFRGRCELEYPA